MTATRILLVEDNPADARLVQEILQDCRDAYQLEHVTTLHAAFDMLRVDQPLLVRTAIGTSRPLPFDIILLSLSLPDSGGLETVQKLTRVAPELPIIVMTGVGVEEVATAAVAAGAQDYLVKGAFEPALLQRAISYSIERKHKQLTLHRHIFYDSTTGLPNRSLLLNRIERAMLRHDQYKVGFGVLSTKLDNYQRIADSYGQQTADGWLTRLCELLGQLLGAEDTLARPGAGWLVVLVEGGDQLAELSQLALAIQRLAERPIQLDGRSLSSSTSSGITSSSIPREKPSSYLQDARVAMHRAREIGGGSHQVFDAVMHERVVQQLKLEQELRDAIERDELICHYQPIVWLQSGIVAGFEALLRWNHPTRGLVSPDSFLSAAESAGLMPAVLEQVIPKAIAQLSEWQKNSNKAPPLTLSINLSASQLQCDRAFQCIKGALEEHPVASFSLAVEITEQVIIDDDEAIILLAQRLRAQKVRVLLDDFGVGYSSLSCLHRFPLDGIKIDRAFVARVGVSDSGTDIVRAIITLAHSLSMSTTAEGIENIEQLRIVQALGCDVGQGYLFSRALAIEDATLAIDAGYKHCAVQLSSRPALTRRRHNGHVLMIDDDRATRKLLQITLEAAGFAVDQATNGTEGLELAANLQPEVILLDLEMPGLDGMEVCLRLKKIAETSNIPVVFYTGHAEDEPVIVEALATGANDILSKDASDAILCARLSSQVTISRSQAKLRKAAVTDELTGLYSRRFLLESMRRALKNASRQGPGLACVLADVDHFKRVNDTLGHLEGDRLLVELANVMEGCTRDTDFVGRFGGEEFVIILPNTNREGALLVAEKICSKVASHTSATVSVGVAYLSGVPMRLVRTPQLVAQLVEKTLRAADSAMYNAKRGGRNRVMIHDRCVAECGGSAPLVLPPEGQAVARNH